MVYIIMSSQRDLGEELVLALVALELGVVVLQNNMLLKPLLFLGRKTIFNNFFPLEHALELSSQERWSVY